MARRKDDAGSTLPSLALVFGYIAVKELQRPIDRIEVLDRLGYGYKEIAKICGLSEGSVAVTLSKLKNSKRRK